MVTDQTNVDRLCILHDFWLDHDAFVISRNYFPSIFLSIASAAR